MLKINLWILALCGIVAGTSALLERYNHPDSKDQSSESKTVEFKAPNNKPERAKYADVPEWYLENRVQIHTRLFLDQLGRPAFFGFPEELAKYHVTVLTRQIKARDEQPWWPTADGEMDPKTASYNSNGQNLAKKIIQQLHDLNMKAIIYYRHSEDSALFVKHPDWACLDIKGEPMRGPRGVFLSLNSPYRDVLMARLKELAAYGADGFYFDQIHTPYVGDFSEYSKKLYKAKYGSDMVSDFRGNKLRFYEFHNATIDNFFTDLRSSLLPYKPVLLISGDSWTNFSGLHMNSEFFQKFILKTELEEPGRPYPKNMDFTFPIELKEKIPGFYLNAFFFSFMRDNSAGPPHVWCRDIKTAEDAINAASGVISLGGIANIDVDANPARTNIDIIKVPSEWNQTYGSYFKDLVPYSSVGVLASADERDKYLGDADEAWEKVLIPAINTFSKLYKAGIPVNVLSDASLNNNETGGLSQIYCNKSMTSRSGGTKLEDFSGTKNLEGKQLALSLNSPIFADKLNEFVHLNYFKDNKGFIYAIAGADFQSSMRGFNEKSGIDLSYQQSNAYKGVKDFQLFIKQDNMDKEPEIENITDKTVIKPTKTEGGYCVFDIKNDNPLLLLRFKSNL